MIHPAIPEHLEKYLSPQFKRNLQKQQEKERLEDLRESVEPPPACIGSKLSEAPVGVSWEVFEVYPGYCQISAQLQDESPSGADPGNVYDHNLKEKCARDHREITSPRGKVQTFSKKSRGRMIKLFGRLEQTPDYWQDLTFSDDIMEGLTLTERAEKSYQCLRRLNQWFLDNHSACWVVWRREWEPRKSGILQGELVPHFHLLIGGGISEDGFKAFARSVARVWVRITGTDNPKALSVALSEKSYRFLVSAKMASIYVSKYVSKTEAHKDLPPGVSLGRMWGKFGKVPEAEAQLLQLSPVEAQRMRRFFARKVSRSSKRYAKQLRRFGQGCFVLIQSATVLRLLEFVNGGLFCDVLKGGLI